MPIYTYEINSGVFFKNLTDYLIIKQKKTKTEKEIINLIRGGYCQIIDSLPSKPIQPKITTLYLNEYIREDYFNKLNFYNKFKEKSIPLKVTICFYISSPSSTNKKIKNKLIELCNYIMPLEIGFRISEVKFKPKFNEGNNISLIENLNQISNLSNEISEFLPENIKMKGKDMAEVYLYLYCVENSLRLFIEKVALNEFGEDYFNKLQIRSNIKKNITSRKEKEEKNKWLGLRGDSDLFYLDFEDLEKIISNNWNIFKDYFPELNWITTKIREMGNCRNMVAHNSFVDEHARNVLKTDYESIISR